MSKDTAIQQAINRASLTMNVSEDVAKALVAAEIHPKLAQVIMNLHHVQQEFDKDRLETQKLLMEITRVVSMSANVAHGLDAAIQELCRRQGFEVSSLFAPEDKPEKN